MNISFTRKSGFTLLEVLISAVIIVVVVGSAVLTSRVINQSALRNESDAQMSSLADEAISMARLYAQDNTNFSNWSLGTGCFKGTFTGSNTGTLAWTTLGGCSPKVYVNFGQSISGEVVADSSSVASPPPTTTGWTVYDRTISVSKLSPGLVSSNPNVTALQVTVHVVAESNSALSVTRTAVLTNWNK